MEQEISNLLAVGSITLPENGARTYASRTVLSLKKYGTCQMCVDYRDLYAQTEKDFFPLLLISEVWPILVEARLLASLELFMGNYQVEFACQNTNYYTLMLYICKVMPFNLCNEPANF